MNARAYHKLSSTRRLALWHQRLLRPVCLSLHSCSVFHSRYLLATSTRYACSQKSLCLIIASTLFCAHLEACRAAFQNDAPFRALCVFGSGHVRAKAITAHKEAIRNLIPQNLSCSPCSPLPLWWPGFSPISTRIKRQTYLLVWTIGWALYSLHFLGPALSRGFPRGPIETSLSRWIYALASICFFLGAQLYAQRKPWIVPRWYLRHRAGLVDYRQLPRISFPFPVVIPSACLFLAVAIIFWQETRRQETLADHLLAISFACWAILQAIALFIFLAHSGQGQQIALRCPLAPCLPHSSPC